MGAYDPQFTPLRRLTCQCDPMDFQGPPVPPPSARLLQLRHVSFGQPNPPENFWLPFESFGFDIRGRQGVRPFLATDLTLFQAEQADIYSLKHAGDGSSLLVALQMPTTNNGADWDFSNFASGVLTPTAADLFDVADGEEPRERGAFVGYHWRTLLADREDDTLGARNPELVAGASFFVQRGMALTQCTDENGIMTAAPFDRGTWGDYGVVADDFGLHRNRNADTFGYLRHYDIGSCSAHANLATLFRGAVGRFQDRLDEARGQFQSGEVRLAFAPVLRDNVTTTVLPSEPGANPFRTIGSDTIQVSARGGGRVRVDDVFLGLDVICDFDLELDAEYSVEVPSDPMGWWERVALRTIRSDPGVNISNCSNPGGDPVPGVITGFVVNTLIEVFSGWVIPDEEDDAERQVDARGSLEDAVFQASRATSLPVPNPPIVAPTGGFIEPVAAFAAELRNGLVASEALLLPGGGPGGSCLDETLGELDDGACSEEHVFDALRAAGPLAAPVLEVLERLAAITAEPITECRPMAGNMAYARTSAFARADTRVGGIVSNIGEVACDCSPPTNVGRLFEWEGRVLCSCVRNGDDAVCGECYRNAADCDLEAFISHDESVAFDKRCLDVGPGTFPLARAPQVFCQPAPSAPPGTQCLPRYPPDTVPPLRETEPGICVPVGHAGITCHECLDLVSPAFEIPGDVSECLLSPSICRAGPYDGPPANALCEATDVPRPPSISSIGPPYAEAIIPFRCALKLPVVRAALQPNQMDIILAEGFSTGFGQDAEVHSDVWSALFAFGTATGANFVPAGPFAAACFPNRNENGRRAEFEAFHRTGYSGRIARLRPDDGELNVLVNQPQCGWNGRWLEGGGFGQILGPGR